MPILKTINWNGQTSENALKLLVKSLVFLIVLILSLLYNNAVQCLHISTKTSATIYAQ